MPFIVLTLSLLFSTYLIVRDCKLRREVSWAVWIPTLLVMILASRPPSRWLQGHAVSLGIENANDLQNSAADQMFFFFVLVSAFIVATKRAVKWGRVIANNSAIMLFYLFFAVSILWSSDPGGSAKRIVKDFGLIFVAGVIFSEKDPLRAMRAVFVRSAFLLIPLSVVLVRYYPDLGRSYAGTGEMNFTGVTTQKNSLGEMVLIFSLFLLWDFFEGRPTINLIRIRPVPWNLLFMLLMGFWLLRLSMSKTSLMSLTVSAVLLLRGKKLMSRKISRAVLTAALALPILVFFSQQFSDVIAPLLGALGRDTTFTGRTEIWSHITLSTVNPLIGSGYWNFWGGPGGLAFNESLHEVIPNAHNGYIDIYLDGGFIGLALLFFFLVVNGGRFAKRIGNSADSDRYQRMKFAVLIAAIIFNLSESVFARMDPLWFTTLLMIYEFPMKAAAVKELQPDSTRLKEEDYFPIPEALSGARLGGP